MTLGVGAAEVKELGVGTLEAKVEEALLAANGGPAEVVEGEVALHQAARVAVGCHHVVGQGSQEEKLEMIGVAQHRIGVLNGPHAAIRGGGREGARS